MSLLILNKLQVLTDTGIHHLRLLHLLGKLSLFMFLPLWIISDGYYIFFDETLVSFCVFVIF